MITERLGLGMKKVKGQSVAFEIGYVLLGLLLLSAIATVVMYVMNQEGSFPQGDDMMYQAYRAQSLYDSIKKGCWYPLYDEYMYSGIQAMRYCSPLSLYCLALLGFVTPTMHLAYVAYLGVLVVLGGTGWLAFGIKYRRHLSAYFVAIYWFFVPENLRIVLGTGNLQRGMVSALIPWLLFFISCHLQQGKEDKNNSSVALIGIAIMMCLLVLSQTTDANMIVLAFFFFLILHSIMNHIWKESIWCVLAVVAGYFLASLWLYPFYKAGGMAPPVNIQTMASYFYDGFQSLNPLYRNTNPNHFYFGLSFFLLGVCGVFLARNCLRPTFAIALFVYWGTTFMAYPILSNLPGGTYLLMSRLVIAALGMLLVGVLLWRQLKKQVLWIICCLLLVDAIPSLNHFKILGESQEVLAIAEQEFDEEAIETLKQLTNQRAAVMDLSTYTSFVPYYLGENEVNQTFGAEWKNASTASNIVMLNEALTKGCYYYLFDRCVELGNDTVMISIEVLANQEYDVELCTNAAMKSGYQLVYEENDTLIYQINPGFCFGTVNEYPSIAIGTSSSYIALLYPEYEETTDPCLTNYTVEELANYESIYLSGFTYSSREQVEEMLLELSNRGCQIYVDMASLPNKERDITGLFDVSIQNVLIQQQFPVLKYEGKSYYSTAFHTEDPDWMTVFLSGIKEPLGSCTIDDIDITFYGIVEENIHLLGFNLVYYATSSGDIVIRELLNEIFQNQESELPVRMLVPVEIIVDTDSIQIQTDYDEVNTTLAYQDIFTSNQSLLNLNNLLIVQRGTTLISFEYTYWKTSFGLCCIGMGLVLLMSWFHRILYFNKKSHKDL